MKEFRCTLCKTKVITERENTLHTTYTGGICDNCAPKPVESADSFLCPDCEKVCKNKLGLLSHRRSHKEVLV